MLVCVKELWRDTDNCEIFVSKWHGWLLTYLTKQCFPSVVVKTDNFNPIKSKFVSTIKKMIDKMGIEERINFNYFDLVTKFDDYYKICVLCKSMVQGMVNVEEFVYDEDELIIIINYEKENITHIPNNLIVCFPLKNVFSHKVYFISKMIILSSSPNDN